MGFSLNKISIIKTFSFIVMAAGLVVIIGWVFDIGFLKSIYPFWVAMKFITAIAFLLSGLILYLIVRIREGWAIVNEILPLLSVIIFLLMATLLASAIFGIHTGIEDLFVRENVGAVKTIIPGSPTIPTMIAFILVAISGFLCFIDYGKFRRTFILLGGIVAAIGATAIAGYLLSLPLLYYYIPGRSGAIAINTSILFIIIGISFALLGKIELEKASIKESKKIFKTSIRFRILFSFLSIGLVSSIFLGYVSINYSQNIMRDEISSKLLLLAEAKEGQIYAYLDFLKFRTIDFSSDGFIKSSLAEIGKSNLTKTAKSLNLHLQAKKSLDRSIAGIMIVDSKGKIVAATDEKEIGKSESEDEYFIKGKTDVYFIEEGEGYNHFEIDKAFVVSAPIRDKDSGKFLGLVVNVFKTDKLSDILSGKYQIDQGAKTSELTRSKALEIYIVNKDKKMFVDSRLAPGGNLNSDTQIEVNTLPVKKCLENNKEVSQVYQNYANKEVLGASMCIAQSGWTIIVEIATAEAFVPLRSIAFGLIAFMIIILLFVVIYAYITGNKISRPIKVLHNAVEIISQGNLDYKVKIGTGDEIEQLGNAFNNMALKLKESYSGLEEKVKEQTNEMSKQLVEIENKNAFLEDTKRAVLNILEDSRELENDLQKFRLAAENAYEHIIITDESGKIIYANSAVIRTTGYTKVEILGKTPALWSGNMPKSYYDKMWDTIKTKKIAFEGEIKNKRKNGEEYIAQISISPILDEKKNIKFYVGLERDITKERNLTEELRKEKEGVEKKVKEQTKLISEEKTQFLASINSISLGFIMFDNNGKVLFINPAVEKIIGTKQEYKEINTMDVILGSGFLIKQRFEKCISEKQPINIKEINFNNKYFHLFMAPIFATDNSQSIIGVVVLIEDETEAKVLDRSKDEFFSIASHELRTPLTAIRGNTSLIKQYYGDMIKGNKDLEEMIDDIHSSSVRLIEIVNDFLSVSRLEQGKMEFRPENFDISELINKTIEEVGGMAKEKGLSLSFQKEGLDGFSVYADKDRLSEVLLNLLGNAIKYTQKGSITVGVSQANGFVKVSFADTGRGIPGEQQNLLFRKFQQAGESILTRDTTKGTGLGLYIAKLMIDSMGGKIQLESSSAENGSVFSFTVPVAKKEG